ncbi:hypothetical protein CFC21_111833 [Triticum aestivum]|uniref:Cytochrome P450 n=3 Tax=Triticinae TaxID=1648030 RepID=A0A9R1MR12_WHEAT|nr:zealexin A1 synthase-like [Triticum aestivum]KAF7111878.1 hypothetical protein CFC21_111833 [Triticum aestivum]
MRRPSQHIQMEDTTSRYYSVYLGWALVLVPLALALTWRKRANNGLRLPPGPWQLPVIGSLHHLVRQLPHRALRDLAMRHGPVMLLRLGSVPTMVLSSPDAAREVLKTQDLAFATRRLTATMGVLTCGGRDMIFAPYGDYWRQLRKIAVTEVLTAGRVRSFRAIREEEVATMLRAIQSAGPVVDLRALLSALVSDGTFRAVMGSRCDSKQRDLFLHELDRIVRLATGLNTADLWPSSWLAGRLSNALRRAEEIHASVFGIIKGIIHEHLERREEGQGGEEDVLDVLLKIHKDGVIDMVAVEGVIFDIFTAGSETSATTLEWAMAELMRNPTAMVKATAEVRRAFEGDGTVDEGKLGELPYMRLVIRETFRLHPPLPLMLPRECQEPCKVLGFDVLKGTQVIVNTWALGRDERSWGPDAAEFRPERFESGAGVDVDFRGTDFELLPFGAGRRMCPGMAFGLASVELPLASMLLHFDWEAPNISNPAEFDMTEQIGVTARRKANLLLRPSLRVPLPTSPPH